MILQVGREERKKNQRAKNRASDPFLQVGRKERKKNQRAKNKASDPLRSRISKLIFVKNYYLRKNRKRSFFLSSSRYGARFLLGDIPFLSTSLQ
jgi:hypothetical protein